MPMFRLHLACFALLLACTPLAAQPIRFEAEVVDADDGTPLPGATAQVQDTDRGDASDASGRLVLALEGLPATVIVRFVGYAPAILSLRPGDARDGVIRRVVRLSPAPYVMGEVAVSAEPPGERIWRRVLARKASLSRALGGYSAEVYTRFLLLRDGRLDVRPVPIRLSESLSNMAWRPAGGLREEIVARRRRPDGGPFRWADVGAVPDLLFEDWLTLDGQRIMAPGHPDAIGAYAFRLGETVEVDGMRMLDLAVVPRRPGLLSGRIRVVDSLWVVAEADLRASTAPLARRCSTSTPTTAGPTRPSGPGPPCATPSGCPRPMCAKAASILASRVWTFPPSAFARDRSWACTAWATRQRR